MEELVRCHRADTLCSVVLKCAACSKTLPECLAHFVGDGALQVCSVCLPESLGLTRMAEPRPGPTCHVLAFAAGSDA